MSKLNAFETRWYGSAFAATSPTRATCTAGWARPAFRSTWSRPTLVEEVAAAPIELRTYVAEQSKAFLADSNAEDLLAAHLNNAQDPAATIAAVRAMLERLSGT